MVIVGTSIRTGVWLKTVGVKLFRGIVPGGTVPIGETVTSGLTILMIVPGVDAGIVALFAGMNNTGICRFVASRLRSIIVPMPLVASVIVKLLDPGTSLPAPIILTGPKQISPVS